MQAATSGSPHEHAQEQILPVFAIWSEKSSLHGGESSDWSGASCRKSHSSRSYKERMEDRRRSRSGFQVPGPGEKQVCRQRRIQRFDSPNSTNTLRSPPLGHTQSMFCSLEKPHPVTFLPPSLSSCVFLSRLPGDCLKRL